MYLSALTADGAEHAIALDIVAIDLDALSGNERTDWTLCHLVDTEVYAVSRLCSHTQLSKANAHSPSSFKR